MRHLERAAVLRRRDSSQHDAERKPLAGLPAVEGVGIARHEMRELGLGVFVLDGHWGGKIAQRGKHGFGPDIFENEALLRLLHRQHARAFGEQIAAVRPDQPDRERNVEGQLRFLPGRRRTRLLCREHVAFCGGVVLARNFEYRRPRLVVPSHELREVGAGGTGCAIGPASSANCSLRRPRTSRTRSTAREYMSAPNSWSRNTVSPSLSDNWNQSRQVTRLPVQL